MGTGHAHDGCAVLGTGGPRGVPLVLREGKVAHRGCVCMHVYVCMCMGLASLFMLGVKWIGDALWEPSSHGLPPWLTGNHPYVLGRRVSAERASGNGGDGARGTYPPTATSMTRKNAAETKNG